MMVRTQIQFPQETLNRLKLEAANRDVSVAEIIRNAVDEHLVKNGDLMARRKRMLDNIGGFRSGLSDLAENHDKYLAEDLAAELERKRRR